MRLDGCPHLMNIIKFLPGYWFKSMAKKYQAVGENHRWQLPGNCPFFAMVVLIYHYVEIIWRFFVTPNFCIIYTIMKKNIQVNQLIYLYIIID